MLEDLEVWYTRLQPLGKDLHREQRPEDPADIKRFFEQVWDFSFTKQNLHQLMLLPDAWPLARLTIPLVNIIKQLELLLQAYCFETVACSIVPEQHEEQVTAFAQDLVQCMALHLAETVAALFYGALQDTSKGLVDSSNAPLLSPKFWLRAIQ